MNIFHELGIQSGEDRINEEVIYNIARVYTTINNALSFFLAAYKISPAKFNILLMVKHVGRDKGMAQNEISKLLLVTTSNITRMIDKLQKEGCVERLAQEGDRRVHLVKITKKGSDLLDTIWPRYKETIDNLVGQGFSRKNKETINETLEKLRGFIKAKTE